MSADAAKLARALHATNGAIAKVCETIRLLTVLDEDDPRIRGLRDAELLARLSDNAVDKIAPAAPQSTEPGSGLPPGSPYLEQKTGKVNI